MRDDFPAKTKELLAKRVAYRCSNPDCRKVTSGPQVDPDKVINVGVAAHITAASPAGPRFDPSLTPGQRGSARNGVWLCQTCAKLVDSDPVRYGVDLLRQWKKLAESDAARDLERRRNAEEDSDRVFHQLEGIMPDLLAEMRTDLAENLLSREFVVLQKRWSYWSRGDELAYYFEDHPQLANKLRILQNYALIQDITDSNVSRYIITEKLAAYLGARRC